MTEEQYKLLKTWEADFRIICHAHYDAAVRICRRNYMLGVPVVAFSVIVGTSVFATLNESPHIFWRILVGLISMATAVLASLQTFMKFSERAEKHREAGARFGGLLKEMEQCLAAPPQNDSEFKEWCDCLRTRWDNLSLESPTVPEAIWKAHHVKESQRLQSQLGDNDECTAEPNRRESSTSG